MDIQDKLHVLDTQQERALERREAAYVNDVAMEKARHKRKMAELASRYETATAALTLGYHLDRVRLVGSFVNEDIKQEKSAERAVSQL